MPPGKVGHICANIEQSTGHAPNELLFGSHIHKYQLFPIYNFNKRDTVITPFTMPGTLISLSTQQRSGVTPKCLPPILFLNRPGWINIDSARALFSPVSVPHFYAINMSQRLKMASSGQPSTPTVNTTTWSYGPSTSGLPLLT